ncbi:amino acid ABC transporter permease [Paenibacillus sp. IB182496]|uniref:Amino acid ABC transporter permease n=1 Tax=Paenibacillus sabuli TaxID=2772509 RepID=A0A927BR72_9BACL|nr:amino acid ABC transporter permease [Paenibacillus sabuli]MBD2844265.1 amino acid ABC transporter permease [Paenibacillus sabuli]
MGEQAFEFGLIGVYFMKLLPTLRLTLLIVVGSIAVGLIAGTLAALPRLYRVPILQRVSQVYVSFFRGTPILIQLFLFYYGLPELVEPLGLDLSRTPALAFVVLAYGLHSGAFISEAIRAAVTAVDRGQVEAAYAVGMSGPQALRRIVLPQALVIAVPVLGNLVIANLKDTSLAFTLGVMELTGKAQTLGLLAQHFLEAYLSLAALYFIISWGLERLFLWWERSLLRKQGVAALPRLGRLGRQALMRRFAQEARLGREGASG